MTILHRIAAIFFIAVVLAIVVGGGIIGWSYVRTTEAQVWSSDAPTGAHP